MLEWVCTAAHTHTYRSYNSKAQRLQPVFVRRLQKRKVQRSTCVAAAAVQFGKHVSTKKRQRGNRRHSTQRFHRFSVARLLRAEPEIYAYFCNFISYCCYMVRKNLLRWTLEIVAQFETEILMMKKWMREKRSGRRFHTP